MTRASSSDRPSPSRSTCTSVTAAWGAAAMPVARRASAAAVPSAGVCQGGAASGRSVSSTSRFGGISASAVGCSSPLATPTTTPARLSVAAPRASSCSLGAPSSRTASSGPRGLTVSADAASIASASAAVSRSATGSVAGPVMGAPYSRCVVTPSPEYAGGPASALWERDAGRGDSWRSRSRALSGSPEREPARSGAGPGGGVGPAARRRERGVRRRDAWRSQSSGLARAVGRVLVDRGRVAGPWS